MMKTEWDKVTYTFNQNGENLHEAFLLALDSTKAKMKIKWRPVWDTGKAVAMTARWYKDFYEKRKINSDEQLDLYINDAINKKLDWCN